MNAGNAYANPKRFWLITQYFSFAFLNISISYPRTLFNCMTLNDTQFFKLSTAVFHDFY